MMTKSKTSYICQQCGGVQSKWSGQCQACGEWNCLIEEVHHAAPKSMQRSKGQVLEFTGLNQELTVHPRLKTHISEFDRVCGDGLVPGSVVLVGGDPGIGKSTLLLQVAANMANSNHETIYISGEEAIDQLRLRAQRLKVEGSPVKLVAATHVTDILASLEKMPTTRLVIIDSIQTMYVSSIDSSPGTVSQVRASAHDLIQYAKKNDVTVIIVGHVTKEGTLAGPRVLEHMVDTVLYFEGERGHQFRILRGVKNRFGATDEIGVFEMTDTGLQEVVNPSALFLSDRQEDVSGAAVFAGIEGTRPLLVEIQALISPTAYGTPRRAVVGWDQNRLAMVIAVLEARCNVNIGMRDVYLNVAGGLRIQEPAADLAVAAALVSALYDQPLPNDAIFCGEVGLSGEIRGITQIIPRLKEAAKLGFKHAYCPKSAFYKKASNQFTFDFGVYQLSSLKELVSYFKEKSGVKRSGTYD
jgi:DNA repair protein RadA/Sms